jgi:MFS family permease
MAAVGSGGGMSQALARPQRRIALYSIGAIVAALVGLVFVCVWIVLMALQWGHGAAPTVLYLPPWVLPILFGIVALVLLGFHWKEVALAEEDRRRDLPKSSPEFLPLGVTESTSTLARNGFRNVLTPPHKTHTIASHVLTVTMLILLMTVGLLLARVWFKQRSPATKTVAGTAYSDKR